MESNTPTNSDENNASQKSSKKLKNIDNKDIKTSSFWLNQIFMIVSTVFGVYLAAQSGLDQALKFDNYSKMEDNYYLRMSLYDEVKDNIESVREYAKILAKSPPMIQMEYAKPNLDNFIWETMKNSPTTLETPSVFLTEIRRFYNKADKTMNVALERKTSARNASRILLEAADKIEPTLVQLQASAIELQKELKTNGIEVGSLKVTH